MRMTASSRSSPEHHHVASPGESEGKAFSHQHHFLRVLGFALQVIYSRLGWVLTSLDMWELNLVWLQISHNRVWFESCQCRDECYRKNKKSSDSCLFVCLRDSFCQMRGGWEVKALGAVASFPSGPGSYQLAFSMLDTCCRTGFAFLLKHAMGFDKNDAEQSRDLGFISIEIALFQVYQTGAAYWLCDLPQGNSVSKWDRWGQKIPRGALLWREDHASSH